MSRPTITSGIIHPLPEPGSLSLTAENQWSDLSLDDRNMATMNLPFIAGMGSPGESLDSDLLSISDDSDQIHPLDSNEPVFSYLNTLLQGLLSGFRNTVQCQLSPGQQGQGFVTNAPSAVSFTTAGTSKTCRKHGQDQKDDDNARPR